MKRLLLLVFSFALSQTMCFSQFSYPVARHESFDTTVFGIKMSDPYFWMSRKENETEMQSFSRQQGQLAKQVLDSITGMEALYQESGELFEAIKDEVWRMTANGKSIYYFRDIPGEGSMLCRRKGPEATEEKVLGRVKINGQNYSVRKRLFSYNESLLAMMLTQNGEANPQIRFFNLETKEFLPDSIAPVMFNDSRGVSMAWSPDNKSLFYTQSPPTNKHAEKYFNGKIMQHRLGTSQSSDKPIFGSGVNSKISLTPAETPYVYSFSHSPYIVARIRSAEGDNYAYAVHISKLNGDNTPWKKLKNYVNLGDAFDANDKWLYAVSTGAPRYRVVKIDMSTGNTPVEFLPQQQDVIAGTDFSHNKAIIAGSDVLYVLLRKIGDMQILKLDLKSRETTLLRLPRNHTVSQLQLFNGNDLLFCLSSPVKMDLYQWYEHRQNKVHGFSFADKVLDKSGELKTKVLYAPSRDGKNIPVSVVYANTVDLKNTNAWLIEGYGNGGASRDLYFDPTMYSWIKRGGVYAYAHVRGGGELGEDWTKDGQFPHKMNSVNDVVDIAEWLVKNKYSSPSKIVLMGGSAGTFLVGNAMNQRPELFAAGIYLAGLPDLATHTDAAGAREGNKTTGPKNTAEGFLSNYQQSALYHIPEGKDLPAMLIIHGATDYILSMSPAARYAARLQEHQKGDRPILFLVDWEGGHATINENEPFYILKFALWQTGHPEFQLNK